MKTSKVTADILKKAMMAYLQHHKNKAQKKSTEIPHGRVKIKDLIGHNSGIENIEITDKNIKSFERIARKYNIDYALKRDKSQSPPKYYVFFKAHDTNAISMAFREYTQKALSKGKQRPSLVKRIRRNIEQVKQRNQKSHQREKQKDRHQEL